MNRDPMNRRNFVRRLSSATGAGAALVMLSAGAGLGLSGCASRTPPARWYALRNDAPMQPSTAAAATNAEVWEVSRTVSLPGALDRDFLVLASGQSSLRTLTNDRWAEPLRDSVPRLLLQDLSLLRGPDRTWAAPAPTGVVVARRLRVEVLTLLADEQRSVLQLQARWWLLSPDSGTQAPVSGNVSFDVPYTRASEDASQDSLAAAHRLALWRLAQAIAAAAATA